MDENNSNRGPNNCDSGPTTGIGQACADARELTTSFWDVQP
jgi:hypothetical protein